MPDQSSAATEHAILQEITRPLEALPDDPLSVVAADFPTALRGYERLAVDEYVRQTRRLVAELQATRSPEAAVRRALERVGDQISGILQRAHETAEQITAQSRVEAEDRLEEARREAADLAAAAEQRVRDLDADTDRIWLERQRIVADAEDLAGQLLALAKTAAERFPEDADPGAGPYDDRAHSYDDDDSDATVALPSSAAAAAAASASADADAEDSAAGDWLTSGFADEDHGVEAKDHGAEAEDDEGPYQEPEYDEFDEHDVHERQPASEVEQTMAFHPIKPPADDDEAATTEHRRPTGEDATADDEDSTAVIRPASQAANRRQAE